MLDHIFYWPLNKFLISIKDRKIHMNAKISFFGIGLGAIGLLLALVHFWAGPFSPQPSLENMIASKAASIREAAIAAIKGQAEPAAKQVDSFNTDKLLNLTIAILSGLSVILGILGYTRKKPVRVAGGAVALGAGAIAFQLAAVALGIIIFAILIFFLLSILGIG